MSLVGEMTAGGEAVVVVREGGMEEGAEMDARVAAIMQLQQLQHKQEVMQLLEAHPVTNADTEFRLQLEELVRDHLNTCMALASCSTTHDSSSNVPPFGIRGDTSEPHHHLLERSAEQCHHNHHQQGYDLLVENEEGIDEGERLVRPSRDDTDSLNVPPGLLRPQTGILGRWDGRQDSEPTLRERQVREAELLALSSLHTVSTLDASFLQESPCPRTESSVERPRRVSSLFQMWRELEAERGERERNQLSERSRTRGGEAEVVQMWREFERERQGEIQSTNFSDTMRMPEQSDNEMVRVENISDSGHGRPTEIANTEESPDVEPLEIIEPFRQEIPNSSPTQELDSSRRELHELDGERERVQYMVQRWMRESGVTETGSRATNARPSNRVEWLGEDERERVREMAREWVRVSNFEARAGPGQRQPVHPLNLVQEAQDQPLGQQVSSPSDSVRSQQNHLGWNAGREREMALELFLRSERERQRELEGLSEHRTVSEFAHRNRLQSLLRGRFLRNGGAVVEDRPPSSAAGEIGQLRQRRAVSGLREGFRFRLETIVRSQSNSGSNDGQRRQQEASQSNTPQANTPVTSAEAAVGQDWEGVSSVRRAHDIQSLEDATAYNMELRELLGRRSVTTMLASEFRDRLDQLIRSFIHRQGRTPQPWNISRASRTAPATQPDQRLGQGQADEGRRANTAQTASFMIPPPPPPPPHPLWHQQPMVDQQRPQATLQRPALQRSEEMEWESTSRGLRADVTILQRGVNDLREMMETSIQMQLELQRSVRQEISGALQRMYIGKDIPEEALDGSKWTTVKRGTCCICCDKQIDCLLYRCGHMCTCIKCADELHKNSGRCPMCRASIVEVVRAFTVT